MMAMVRAKAGEPPTVRAGTGFGSRNMLEYPRVGCACEQGAGSLLSVQKHVVPAQPGGSGILPSRCVVRTVYGLVLWLASQAPGSNSSNEALGFSPAALAADQ